MDLFHIKILSEFFATCEEVRTRSELIQCIEQVTSSLGIDYAAMVSMPLPHERIDNFFLWQKWPEGWFERYLKLNYFNADPVAILVRQTGRSVIWSKALDRRTLPTKARRIMNEARDFGLVDGLTIPLHSTTGDGGIFSVAGRRNALTGQEVKLLQMVAASAYSRLHELERIGHPSDLLPHITRAESECLTWCVAGKTDREIGRITGRSPRTVQDHILRLQRKLSASNRAQMIAEAFRRGLQR
ncbi:DNA-binding CsgD family transcriptional regulator [Rhizobium sp. BK650]|uniref:LuxR family transcriptional regulator n=1 Tax=Rhizobium sp. BK650 TaxID=2586990 RepID=UPI0017F22D13|nr:LuxR family transcriptional regulator [Rhizobium sp. BK650]MBB3659719.1 DNA-binding CsgD family transcriptional regulator [Rhizobium sp. BK650]